MSYCQSQDIKQLETVTDNDRASPLTPLPQKGEIKKFLGVIDTLSVIKNSYFIKQ